MATDCDTGADGGFPESLDIRPRRRDPDPRATPTARRISAIAVRQAGAGLLRHADARASGGAYAGAAGHFDAGGAGGASATTTAHSGAGSPGRGDTVAAGAASTWRVICREAGTDGDVGASSKKPPHVCPSDGGSIPQ
jgi:hypothetical protein